MTQDTPVSAQSPGPAFSVIITNYNYARFLRQAIDSVLAQTYASVECIVVDDGSTDGSQDIIASYPGVMGLFQKNQGQAQALRAGVALARGDIIISLDADDYLYAETCVRVAEKWQNGVSCVNYKLDLVHNGRKTGEQYPGEAFVDTTHIEVLERLGYYPSAPMSGNAFARSYASFILNEAVHLDGDGVDAYLLYSAPVFGKMAHVDKALGAYRLHGSNISMSSGKKTIKNLGDHIYYQYWAYQNFQTFARAKGLIKSSVTKVRGPYLQLWYLMVQNGRYSRFELPKESKWELFIGCVQAFLVYPNIRPVQRLKNISVAAILTFAPAPVTLMLLKLLVVM